MADLDKKPVKGILKNTSSFDKGKCEGLSRREKEKEMKWDEMNILATYHPPGKDYGHDQINEPPTPYNRSEGDGDDTKSGDESECFFDPELLAQGLTMKTNPKVLTKSDTYSSGEDEEDDTLTEEERERKRAFRMHRKQHYNEFQAVKLARQLLQEEEDDEDADDEDIGCKSDYQEDQTGSGDRPKEGSHVSTEEDDMDTYDK